MPVKPATAGRETAGAECLWEELDAKHQGDQGERGGGESWGAFEVNKQGRELGTVTKKWAGLGRELFTSADNYIISLSDVIGLVPLEGNPDAVPKFITEAVEQGNDFIVTGGFRCGPLLDERDGSGRLQDAIFHVFQ